MIDWMDNFGSYGTTKAFMSNGIYANVPGALALTADPDPGAVGTVARIGGMSTLGADGLRKVLSSGQTTVGMAMRIFVQALPGATSYAPVPMVFANGANSVQVALRVNPTGGLQAVLNQLSYDATPLAETDGPVLVTNAWQHIEMKVFFHATTGTVEVRVDGVTVIDEENLDTLGTATGPCEQVWSFNQNSGGGFEAPHYLKDFVIWNNSGSHNTDFIGSVTVYRLVPTADVTLGGWTTSSGATGFNLIDESPPVDGGYVQASDAPPAACEFSLTDLPVDVTSVRGLMTLVRMQKTDGGDATMQVSVGSDGDYANGADRPITPAFTYWFDIQEEDPATNAPWLPSAVNLATLVLDRTT